MSRDNACKNRLKIEKNIKSNIKILNFVQSSAKLKFLSLLFTNMPEKYHQGQSIDSRDISCQKSHGKNNNNKIAHKNPQLINYHQNES